MYEKKYDQVTKDFVRQEFIDIITADNVRNRSEPLTSLYKHFFCIYFIRFALILLSRQIGYHELLESISIV